jgi:hypothetical protein
MPSLKSDINVTVRVGGKTLSIGGVLLPNGRYAIKRGRSWAKKIPTSTLTGIFSEARKWAARNVKP